MGRWSAYIGSQFGNPRGVVGACCCLIMNCINRAMYDGIVNRIALSSRSAVLDVGYGNGYLIQRLYRMARPMVWGIDISEDMQKAAARRNRRGVAEGRVRLELGDCCAPAFGDGMFDAVTTVNTVYFWRDPAEGFSQLCRVLKPGGVLYNAFYTKEWLEKLSYTRTGFRLFTEEELIALSRAAGFSPVEVIPLAGGKSRLLTARKPG